MIQSSAHSAHDLPRVTATATPRALPQRPRLADLSRGRLPPERLIAASLLFHALAAVAARALAW